MLGEADMPGLIGRFVVVLVVCFGCTTGQPQRVSAADPQFVRDTNLNQIMLAAFSYASAAHACELTPAFKMAKADTVLLFERANRSGELTQTGQMAYENLTECIEKGATEFRRKSYITCGEVPKYVKQIHQLVDKFR